MKISTALRAVLGLFALAALTQCQCSPVGTVPPGGDCENAQQCAGETVCDPDSDTCAEDVECTSNSECGVGALCEDETCVANVAGGPCEVDDNCVAGEDCRSGTCLVPGAEGSACTSAEECADGLICPGGSCTVATTVNCTGNADCGPAAFCDDGTCAPAGLETACEDDDDCTEDARCLGVICIPDVCAGQAFEADPVQANVMLVVDRSGSMEQEIGNEGPKWEIAKAAVADLVTSQGDNIRFGLSLYPGTDRPCVEPDEQCREGYIPIDLDDDTGANIISEMAASDTCRLGTPTAENLSEVLDYTPLQDGARNNYVLLITDGQSTCDNPIPVVTALANRTPPTPTFVVGFGDGVDRGELNDMAEAGGTALPGNTQFYEADDGASLEQALNDIAGEVLSCDYDIPPEFDDPALLSVFFNGQSVAPDPSGTTGWIYDPPSARLTFAGNACTALQSGSVEDLTIVFGCPRDEPPPPPDAGPPPPPPDGGPPPPGCPEGQTLPCQNDNDCCDGEICLDNGECIQING